MKKLKYLIACLLLVGCTSKDTITINQAEDYMKEHKEAVLIDVRTKEEFDAGHLYDALNIPLDTIDGSIEKTLTNKNQEILVYCRSGNRSGKAKSILEDLGYTNVKNVGGVLDYEGQLTK